MKRQKLFAFARTIEQEAIDLEDWLDLHQSKLPRRVRIQINEAIRSLDDAAYHLVYLIDGGAPTIQEILDGVESHSAIADEVERLRADNQQLRADAEEFQSAYRMKCDEETKALRVEIERLRDALEIIDGTIQIIKGKP